MPKNPPADLFTFTKEIFNERLHLFVNTLDNKINISVNKKPLGPSLY